MRVHLRVLALSRYHSESSCATGCVMPPRAMPKSQPVGDPTIQQDATMCKINAVVSALAGALWPSVPRQESANQQSGEDRYWRMSGADCPQIPQEVRVYIRKQPLCHRTRLHRCKPACSCVTTLVGWKGCASLSCCEGALPCLGVPAGLTPTLSAGAKCH